MSRPFGSRNKHHVTPKKAISVKMSREEIKALRKFGGTNSSAIRTAIKIAELVGPIAKS